MCVGVYNFSPEQVCFTKSFVSNTYIHTHTYSYTKKKNQTKIRNKQHAVHDNKHLVLFLNTPNNSTVFFKKKPQLFPAYKHITKTYC